VLAYIPSPAQGVWQIGPFPLRAYALCIILGIVVAIWWGERRWRERGGQPGAILDVAMFAVPFGLIGGRLYHVATDWQKYFGADGHPIDALKIYQGGLGIWGAVFLGGIGAWIGCRVYRIPLPALGDAVAPPILLAQAIGRLGNYFNQELYGRETDLPWGLEIYLRFDDLLIVVLLVQIDKRYRIGHGRLFAAYVAGYCVGRFAVELMRDDEATKIAGIRINSFTSALVFLGAVAYFVFATKGRETAEQLQPSTGSRPWPWQIAALRAAAAERADADSAHTASDSDAAPDGDTDGAAGATTAASSEKSVGLDKAAEPEEPTEAEESADAAKSSDAAKSVESDEPTALDQSTDSAQPTGSTEGTSPEKASAPKKK
jgi:prolipoprotein diacylglyceryltransferase